MKKSIARVLADTIRNNYKVLVPLIHFLLSFMWERFAFTYSDVWIYFNTKVRDENVITNQGEMILVWLLSRIFSLLIIWVIWKAIFYVWDGNVRKNDIVILGTIFLIGSTIAVFLYPDSLGMEIDNYANYLMAIRFRPTYWQSIYTGALYAGSMMVLPHPIAISFVQWVLFWETISYIFLNIRKFCDNTMLEYLPLVLFILPESYMIAYNSYRNDYYTILLLFYISYSFFAIEEQKNKKIPTNITFAALTSFVMVWRKEGIIIGFGTIIIWMISYCLVDKKERLRTILSFLICFALAVGLMVRIDSVGSAKYYGNDYRIINTTDVLYGIFNDPNVRLNYEGADEDLKAIESIVPVEVLKEQGMEGYRNYNWTKGYADFNQTLATDENSQRYLKAYRRIIWNNLKTYLDIQSNKFCTALQLGVVSENYRYDGEATVQLENYVYGNWKLGRAKVMTTPETKWWLNNQIRIVGNAIIQAAVNMWWGLLINSGVNQLLHVCALISAIVMVLVEFIRLINKKKISIKIVIAMGTILAEGLAVLLFMPEGREAYLYPVLYAIYLLLLLYVVLMKMGTGHMIDNGMGNSHNAKL